MKNPENGPQVGNEATQELVEKELQHLELDSITQDEEMKRLINVYSTEKGKQLLLNDLESNEAALIAHKNEIGTPLFKELFKAYSHYMSIYERVFKKPYKMQLDIDTGAHDYAEELHQDSKHYIPKSKI